MLKGRWMELKDILIPEDNLLKDLLLWWKIKKNKEVHQQGDRLDEQPGTQPIRPMGGSWSSRENSTVHMHSENMQTLTGIRTHDLQGKRLAALITVEYICFVSATLCYTIIYNYIYICYTDILCQIPELNKAISL